MQHILLVASILLAILPSCKKSSSSSSAPPSSAASGTGSCPVNMGLLTVPKAPANVPAANMNQLGLTFNVSPAVDSSGVTNFNLSITPNPINPWDGMPSNLNGRLADFPRVSICDANSNCVVVNSSNKVVSQKNGSFDFPFWNGTVAIPNSMTGTLFFKASACTYIRNANGTIQAAPNNMVCGTYQTPASPAEIERPALPSGATNAELQQMGLQYSILSLGNYLYAPALGYMQGVQPNDQAGQILSEIAQNIVQNPYAVGAFLGGPLYSDFQSQVQGGGSSSSLQLAGTSTDPCTQALSGTAAPVPSSLTNSNGTLIGPSTVTVTNTTTGGVTTVASVETVQNTLTETTTAIETANSSVAMMNYKIRVLDPNSNVLGCVQESPTTTSQVTFGPCADNNFNRWNLQPAPGVTGWEISSVNNGQCITQTSTGLTITACSPTNQAQYFQFTLSQTQTTAPSLGTNQNGSPVLSSPPYAMLGFQGGVAVNCENQSGTGFTMSANTGSATSGPVCTTLYSLDNNNQTLTGMQTYAATLGVKNPNEALLGTIGSAMTFGGIMIGLVGAGVAVSAGMHLWGASTQAAEAAAASASSLTNVRMTVGPENAITHMYSVVIGDEPAKQMTVNEIKENYNVTPDKLTAAAKAGNIRLLEGKPVVTDGAGKVAQPSGKFALPNSSAEASSGRKFTAIAGGVTAVAGILVAIAGGTEWGVAGTTNLAANPTQNFINAILAANVKFICYNDQLQGLPCPK